MKKISIFIFVIVSFFVPLFFASAAITMDIKIISKDNVSVTMSGLQPSSKYFLSYTNKRSSSGANLNVTSDANGNAIKYGSLNEKDDYSFILYDGNRTKLIEKSFGSGKDNLMKITGFSPVEGKVGDIVTVTGENFSGVDKIFFGNIESTIDSVTLTSIKTKVPTSAVDGKIKVKTVKNGVALDLVSTNDFKTKKDDSKIDYYILENLITTTDSLISSSKEGTAIGEYPVGSITSLSNILKSIKEDYEFIKKNSGDQTVEVIQDRIRSDLSDLQIAIDDFKSKVIKSVSGGSVDEKKTDLSSKGGGLIPECPDTGCGFNELMQLINNVIKFLLFDIATPLAALGIVYAGWLYLSAGGSTENTTKAKKILTNIVIGYIIALSAWLIVNTLLKSLGLDSSINTFLK